MGMVKNGRYHHQSKLFVNKHVFYFYKAQILAEKKREKEMGKENGKTKKRHIGLMWALLIGGTHF